MKRRHALLGLLASIAVGIVALAGLLPHLGPGRSPDVGAVPSGPISPVEPVESPVEPREGLRAVFADARGRSGRVDHVFRPEPLPVALVIGDIELAAPVVDVGVDGSGLMEVPGVDQVGWYRHGPRPGEAGSSVLAAHVDSEERPGAFARLSQVEPGAVAAVGFDDGSVQFFEIVGRRQYGKSELPVDEIFADEGQPILTLVTCGGSFDPSSRSYSDNLVAYAVPIAT